VTKIRGDPRFVKEIRARSAFRRRGSAPDPRFVEEGPRQIRVPLAQSASIRVLERRSIITPVTRSASAAIICVLAAITLIAREPLFDRLLLIAPAAPGGGWDQTARALQQVFEAEGLVRVTEVQNVPGAAGTIGLAQFADTQRASGRALLVSGLVMLGATLWNASPVSLDQATPIARLTGEYEVVAVPATSPYRELRDLVDALRRHPEGISWGGGSAGGTDHILAGLIAEAARVDPRRVNYIAFSGGGEAVAAVLGSNVTAGVSGYSEFAPHVESGRLRVLAISARSRVPGIDAPTLQEQGLSVELVNWRAVVGPPGMSDDDKARLTDVVARAARSARWQRILADRGWADAYLDGDAFARYLTSERLRLEPVVARLRGPSATAPVAAGQHIFPVAVFTGAAGVMAMLLVQWRRGSAGGRAADDHPPANRRAIARMVAGLVLFVVLLEPLGFIVAAAALFICAASAFGAPSIRAGVVGVVLCAIVYLAFTRGLDLTLPSGAAWAWMR
jgi:putative tricarboxylic transport membrane protein